MEVGLQSLDRGTNIMEAAKQARTSDMLASVSVQPRFRSEAMMSSTVEQHFEGRDQTVRDIYETIVTAGRSFGPLDEDPKKTSIHLNRRSAFAGIQTRRQGLILTIKSTCHR